MACYRILFIRENFYLAFNVASDL